MELTCNDEDFYAVAKIVGRVADNWDDRRKEEARELVDLLCKMDKNRRIKVVRNAIEDVMRKIGEARRCMKVGGTNCGNPIQIFLNWLDTPSGVIAYAYMWEPEFAELMVKLLVSTIFVIKTLASGISSAK